MEDPDTDTLRKLAPCWTLEGDERLLTILQNTHQKLISKCQDANSQLEQMVTALDDASISLQNVNNQFMSLSSSQFIERRVYDDDVDVAADTPAAKESPKPSPPDELSILKRSIAVIERSHEVITILQDSDTESDSDDDVPDRLVMKPKDVYADRPLPYIIGSDPWKNKWHAGLMAEDSDTDSTTSKVDRQSDQYSQSEPEELESGNRSNIQDVPAHHDRNLSESSSELPSEATPISKPTPSDVARELARRLGGGDQVPKSLEPEPEYEEPTKPAVRKIYKPEEPVASTIFPDEPPPLDYQTDSDPDIFAGLDRNQPYNQPYNRPYRATVTEDLFGDNETDDDEGGDIFSDFANQPITKPTSLFDAGPKPHMFNKQTLSEHPSKTQPQATDQPTRPSGQPAKNTAALDDDRGVKKPVGGISLFGSNKGTEIGAAILKRNQRKQSTSDEESTSESLSQPSPAKETQAKKEKDIFDDLFAKSETKKTKPKVDNVVNDIKQHIQKKDKETMKKDTPKPVDLFSDNLFDDIDDIFTTSVIKTSKEKQKSIFDDEDDLFSDIADTKPVKQEAKNRNDNKKSLFDSDDDLFAENVAKPSLGNKPHATVKVNDSSAKINENPIETLEQPSKIETPKINEKSTKIAETAKESTSIFDDDEDDIFSNIKTNKEITKVQNVADTGSINVTRKSVTSKDIFKSPSLFDDDDDDESDLFTDSTKSSNIITKGAAANKVTPKTPSKIEEEVFKDKTEINNTVSADKVLNEASDKTEVEISEVNIDVSPKSDSFEEAVVDNEEDIFKQESKEKNDILNKPNTTIDDVVKENIENDDSQNVQASFVSSSHKILEAVKENDTINSANIDTKNTPIQEKLDNDIEIPSDNDFSEPESQVESLPDTKPIQPDNNTITDTKSKDIHTVVLNDKITDKHANVHDIFDNSLLEEDIFASPNIVPNFTNKMPETSKTEIDNNDEKIPSSDIFNDIVTEPPAFEKPKEPKKSKNVNALFDDDSDDESLFFKKDDVVTDEKPDDFAIKQDRLFDIFIDEPPDVDFTKINDDLGADLFSTLPTPKAPSEIANSDVKSDFEVPVSYEIPISEDNTEDTTAVPEPYTEPETSKLKEDTFIPELKKNIDDLLKPNIEINKAVSITQSGNIFDDTDDMFKPPASMIDSTSDKRGNWSDDDDELFKSLPVQLPKSQTEIFTKNEQTDYKSDEELFKSLPNIDKTALPNEEISKSTIGRNISFKQPTEKARSAGSDSNFDKSEGKKVGKLKVGFNINVNALLPGASPKKVKPVDSLDGQVQSQAKTEKDALKLSKPVSFDGKPESEVLDNKLSKERPRIQVKRRPSTRKARREAVRKSGIDFGDDSTDNSSSIDDPPKIQTEIVKTGDNKTDDQVKNVSNEEISKHSEENYLDSPKVEPRNIKPDDKPIKVENETEELDNPAKIETFKHPVKSDSTTKIVYILNDEDIFNTSTIETPETKEFTNINKENVIKNTDVIIPDVVKVTDNINANTDSIIKTLGNVYQSKKTKTDENKKSKSLFGEDDHSDDDEIFKNKKPVAKKTIFDSDSEGELFGSTKKINKVKKVKTVMKEVKGSLFGDDNDDDDDLFGVKSQKTVEPQPTTSKSTPSVKDTTSTQPVFKDPLSMFGDD